MNVLLYKLKYAWFECFNNRKLINIESEITLRICGKIPAENTWHHQNVRANRV